MSGRATIARALWGLLALIHIWPLIAVLMKLAATPTLDRAASLLLLVALIAFSTAKAAGVRLLRSDRPRMELMVWLLAGGILHGGGTASWTTSSSAQETRILLSGPREQELEGGELRRALSRLQPV